jgi:hypothetical protein
LLGLLGWTVLLLWGWVQVGRSLSGPVLDEMTAETGLGIPEGNKERDSNNVIPTTSHD